MKRKWLVRQTRTLRYLYAVEADTRGEAVQAAKDEFYATGPPEIVGGSERWWATLNKEDDR